MCSMNYFISPNKFENHIVFMLSLVFSQSLEHLGKTIFSFRHNLIGATFFILFVCLVSMKRSCRF